MSECASPPKRRNRTDGHATSTRALLALLVVSTHILLVGCLGPSAAAQSNATLERSTAVEPTPATAVALVEWQFPVGNSPSLRVHPLQNRLGGATNPANLRPAFYPYLSEVNADDSEHALARLTQHGTRVAQAYAAGRETFTRPFLLNVSAATPAALRALIAAGVRVVSFSVGEPGDGPHLAWIDDLVRDFPNVLFLVATPHISGNSIRVEDLGQRPSVLATRGHANVLLVGTLALYDEDVAAHHAGRRIGTAANPFAVDSQPTAANVRQIYLLNSRSTRVFVEGFGASSAAAPHLASLLGLIAERRVRCGLTVDASSLIDELARVTHRAMAQEKTGELREVAFFTLDTILLNAGRPLVTEAIWEGTVTDAPVPLTLGP